VRDGQFKARVRLFQGVESVVVGRSGGSFSRKIGNALPVVLEERWQEQRSVRQTRKFQVLLNSCLLCCAIRSGFKVQPLTDAPTVIMRTSFVFAVGRLRNIGQRPLLSCKHEDADI
jgi:hypothetical protein